MNRMQDEAEPRAGHAQGTEQRTSADTGETEKLLVAFRTFCHRCRRSNEPASVREMLEAFGLGHGVEPTPKAVNQAYRKLALALHPDKNDGATEHMQVLSSVCSALRAHLQSGAEEECEPRDPDKRLEPHEFYLFSVKFRCCSCRGHFDVTETEPIVRRDGYAVDYCRTCDPGELDEEEPGSVSRRADTQWNSATRWTPPQSRELTLSGHMLRGALALRGGCTFCRLPFAEPAYVSKDGERLYCVECKHLLMDTCQVCGKPVLGTAKRTWRFTHFWDQTKRLEVCANCLSQKRLLYEWAEMKRVVPDIVKYVKPGSVALNFTDEQDSWRTSVLSFMVSK